MWRGKTDIETCRALHGVHFPFHTAEAGDFDNDDHNAVEQRKIERCRTWKTQAPLHMGAPKSRLSPTYGCPAWVLSLNVDSHAYTSKVSPPCKCSYLWVSPACDTLFDEDGLACELQ